MTISSALTRLGCTETPETRLTPRPACATLGPSPTNEEATPMKTDNPKALRKKIKKLNRKIIEIRCAHMAEREVFKHLITDGNSAKILLKFLAALEHASIEGTAANAAEQTGAGNPPKTQEDWLATIPVENLAAHVAKRQAAGEPAQNPATH